MCVFTKLLVFAVSATSVASLRLEFASKANPIRKVVNMLQAMQKKVQAEGKKQEDLFEKFMCYCKTGAKDLQTSIDAAEDKMPQLTAKIDATTSKLAQSKQTLADSQDSRNAAKSAMAEATGIREKEAATFAQTKSDLDTNIAALGKAIAALEKGAAGAFLQTGDAQALHRYVARSESLDDYDRQQLLAFLEHSSGYAPQSGQITGILKQMSDEMKKDLEDATNTENEAIKNYEELMAAKNKEVQSLTETIEHKIKQIGELGVENVALQNDLEDTSGTYSEDKKFLAELGKSCKTKTAEWEEIKKTRAEELLALADTIKVLNDDDALDLFKGTLGKKSDESFMQMSVSGSSQRVRALNMMRSARKHVTGDATRLDLLTVALSGKADFSKVIKMIDDMIKLCKQEQVDDDNKKEYCAKSLDENEDKRKSLSRDISDMQNEIATVEDAIATLAEEITALVAGIKELDKRVAEATEQRKKENAAFKELMQSDSAAKEILHFAKNRLNKFYNPKLYKPPAQEERSAEDRIGDSYGMTRSTAAPGGIAGTGISSFMQLSKRKAAPPPPPETFGAYSKKSSENTGVIAMIDLLVSDLDKEMAEAKTAEKDAQADYETLMKDSAEKRTKDSESVTDKESAKADAEARLSALKEDKTKTAAELSATEEFNVALHAECDWNLKYHDARKEARANEIDSMKNAKATLQGANLNLF